MRQVELLGDLTVGQPPCRHLSDLELLRREPVPRAEGPALAGLTRRAQLLPGPFAPRHGAKGIEYVPGGTQRRARFGDSPLAAKPGAIGEQDASSLPRPAGRVLPESVLEEGFGGIVLGQERSRIKKVGVQERSRRNLGYNLQFTDHRSGDVSITGIDRRLGKIADRPAANDRMVGRIHRVKDASQLAIGVIYAPRPIA